MRAGRGAAGGRRAGLRRRRRRRGSGPAAEGEEREPSEAGGGRGWGRARGSRSRPGTRRTLRLGALAAASVAALAAAASGVPGAFLGRASPSGWSKKEAAAAARHTGVSPAGDFFRFPRRLTDWPSLEEG